GPFAVRGRTRSDEHTRMANTSATDRYENRIALGSRLRPHQGGRRRQPHGGHSMPLVTPRRIRHDSPANPRVTEFTNPTGYRRQPSGRGADGRGNEAGTVHLNVRIKISALWTSMLFVFVYVDLFSLYRRDFRADLAAGEVGGFSINQSFLVGTTVY